MTPTLMGRFQTRLFTISVVGSLWVLFITPLLPSRGDLGAAYWANYRLLAIVLVVGFVWDAIYYGLQQFRWEKDWPTMFGFLNGFNEGLSTWVVAKAFGFEDLAVITFVVMFATTWVVVWGWINGPMKVVFIRWRFHGGRIW